MYRSVGSQEAFAEIFRRFKNDIYNLLVSMGVKPDAADDLTQEVFIVVARRPELYDMGRPLKPWLLKIAILRLKQKRRNDYRQCRDGRRTTDRQPPPECRRSPAESSCSDRMTGSGPVGTRRSFLSNRGAIRIGLSTKWR